MNFDIDNFLKRKVHSELEKERKAKLTSTFQFLDIEENKRPRGLTLMINIAKGTTDPRVEFTSQVQT